MDRRLLLPLLALSASLAPWGAPEASAQAAGVGEPLPVDGAVLQGELENGLRYYIRANDEPRDRAELRLVVNAGSVLEASDQRGLAHFLEHMAFNGTRNFEKHELVDYLESVGMRFGPDVNAYTSFDETVYMLTLPTDSVGVLETGFQILEDWAHGITFDSLEVEKERGVVVEEWRLGQGAGNRMQNQQFPVLTRDSRYASRLPIGTEGSLRSFRHAALRRFYRDWYRPDLMAVVAVGDFDPARVEALIRERFAPIPRPRRAPRRREFRVPDHRDTRVSVVTDPEATGASVSLYLKRQPQPWRTTAAYREWIVESLASSMLVNRLSELTQRPAAPFLDVSSFHGRFLRPLAAYVLSTRVPEGGISSGLGAVLTEVNRAARHGFADTELEREKREMLRLMEQRFAERDKTTSGGFAADYVSNFLYGGSLVNLDAEYALYRRFVPSVSLDEVNDAARRWMREGNRVVLVKAPERPGLAVPGEEELRRVIAAARSRAVVAYTDSLSSAPLVGEPPHSGTVETEREIPEIGVTEWELSNGVRVILKPTDFREDEVLLVGRSPGGTSLVSDSDYVAALTASAVVQVGGIGELSSIELRKRLAGKVAGVGANIGDAYEGLSGAASPRDLETLFQLVYLKFTAPRVDTAAFEAYREQARQSLQSRSASPEVVFSDSLRSTLTRDHPRARPPTSALFDALDMHRSFEIYRDRFADASDFTFYLVGSFDLETIRPLVETYLGGLPALHRVEEGRDLGIRPPDGIVRKTVRKGMEPKALTQIVFTGPLDFSRDHLYGLDALADVLRIRLREVLREDLGGTYGVEVRGTGSLTPEPRYQVSIGFGTDPGRLEELTAVVFAQIDSLKLHGPTAEDMRKVREMQLRARETDLRQNQFWIQQLIAFRRYDWDPRDILGYGGWVASLEAETLRRAAIAYLDPASFVQVSLLPEVPPERPDADPGTELPSGRGVSDTSGQP